MKGGLEGARDDEVAKAVKDDIDGNPLLGFPREMLLKFLANRISFPDVGFQINTPACRIDGFEHRIVEIASVGEQLEGILADLHFVEKMMGKADLVLAPFPQGSDNEQNRRCQDL